MARSFALVGQTPFIGIRVDGFTTYIPAYIKPDGNKVGAQCIINCYANTRGRNGREGRHDRFRFTAWGKLADSCAIALHKGMAIDVLATPQAYKAQSFVNNAAGQRVAEIDAAGQPIKRWSVGYRIDEILMAEECQDHIDAEIVAGLRPQFWNVKGHQHYEAWGAILQQRKANRPVFDPNQQTFGFAKVTIPQGVTIDMAAYAPTQTAPAPMPTQYQMAPVQQFAQPNPAQTAGMVQHAVNTYPQQTVRSMPDPNAALNGFQRPAVPVAPAAPNAGFQQVPAVNQFTVGRGI